MEFICSPASVIGDFGFIAAKHYLIFQSFDFERT
jgi:hypothetical protein